MNPTLLRIGFALFLIAHGYIHMSLSTVPLPQPGGLHTPYWPAWWREATDPSWPASRLGLSPELVRTAGWALWAVVVGVYSLAGLGLLGVPGLHAVWQPLAVGASLVSLLLLGLYWHPWLVMGVVLDALIVLGAYLGWFARWS